jgi:hypothetical protein
MDVSSIHAILSILRTDFYSMAETAMVRNVKTKKARHSRVGLFYEAFYKLN